MRKITVELKTPVKYAPDNKGEEVEGSFLEIAEPNGKIAHLVGILKSQIGAASKRALEGIDLSNLPDSPDKKDDDKKDDGKGDVELLLMGGADMAVVMTTFKEILRESADMGGEKRFTAPMFDRMAYSDIESCLGRYIGNFINQ